MGHIAYIAGYQGPGLIIKRNISRNLALAGSRKISLISKLLSESGHTLDIISCACSAERSRKIYRRFSEFIPGITNLKVLYAFSIDIKFIGIITSVIDVLLILFKEHRKNKFNCVIIYNYGIFEVFYLVVVKLFLRIPVFLEYEDDAWVNREGYRTFFNRIHEIGGRPSKQLLSGCFAVTPKLIDQIGNKNSFLLRGIVSKHISSPGSSIRKNIVLYTGSMDMSKGVDRLIEAWISLPEELGWKLVVTGDGVAGPLVKKASVDHKNIEYLGVVSSECILRLYTEARIGINPHRLTNEIGNIFPFKIIEYLAAGLVVLSTPMLEIEDDLKHGIYFSKSDSTEDIALSLMSLLTSPPVPDPEIAKKTILKYGEDSVKKNLCNLLQIGGVSV